ncbi:Sensor histidine kinase YpdA [Paenibacillus konkukensis]|uniref:Sensor histidine kinase YpdA n=1 Tax=Paenibacillus konkukensis TaxID=2020716 RepID=A0ABY4RUJ2_9BACL|nr:histidine kinase [Paenibacillus konkukensis]UQZ86289.1 Sensor histidine kinase YpdA [Paenibacillus konkukensis]
MRINMNTFGKVITLIVSLLVPIIVLYGYSHQVSVDVVKQTVEDGNRNRLSFFMSQMESMIEQLSRYSVVASKDYSITEYLNGRSHSSPIVQVQRQQRISEMLNMQIATSSWNNQLILYMTDSREIISTDYSVAYSESYLRGSEFRKWSHRALDNQTFFSRISESDKPNLLVEVRFADDNIENMLNLLKQGGDTDPFLYQRGQEPLTSRSANLPLVKGVIDQLERTPLEKAASRTITLNGEQYVVNYIRSESLGWYLVDYVPLEKIYSPITVSRNLFYVIAGLLLLLSILVTLLLYRHVQIPIRLLIRGVQRIKDGQYSARLKKQPNNEFDFLFNSFNEMAEQIQDLIEKVYKETLRSKEATLKQLQAQINPHFLYNCLFYIKSMANLGEKEAVAAMALNLGEYYRYATRTEKQMTKLREELKLVENYLIIQNLRMERFHYEIDIPEAMLDLTIPRLVLQPLVENAIVHGIENSPAFGLIAISGESRDGLHRIIVDDNGSGITEEGMCRLQKEMTMPMGEDTGCGLWNIHQRLSQMYEGRSGLSFSPSPMDGFRVVMAWEDRQNTHKER